MKNNKGFTLVEILAVIIILGILMIIAVPAVTQHISDSRKTTFITSSNKLIEAALDEITDMEYSVSNPDYTYYIPTKCLDAQNGDKSAYGSFVSSFVVVTYKDGKNYFYYTGFDDTGHGILLTYRDLLDESVIKTGLNSIDTTIGVGNRQYVYVYSDSCNKTGTKTLSHDNIDEEGSIE